MKRTFEAIWEQGKIIPTESININDHTHLLVVILDEQTPDRTSLVQEARRQSLLVSKHDESISEIWEANIDDSDWRE
jgi:hypothetical protein